MLRAGNVSVGGTMELIKSYPSRDTIRNYIAHATARVNESMKQSNIAVRHNAFTDYCLSVVFFATGHRPIQDPIQDQKYFDLELGVMLIADKISSEDRAWRAAALGDIACKQLSYYGEYLPRLYSNLSTMTGSEDLLARLAGLLNGSNSLPYFFYLDESNPTRVVSITPALMKKRFEEYWDLPIYLFRHVAATELIKVSRDPRSVKIQLGHSLGPDHPFGATATESVLSKLSEMAVNVDIYMKDLGWKALRSTLRASSVSRHIQVNDKESISANFGYEKRAKERNKRRLLIKPVVKTAIHDVLGEEARLPTVDELNEIIERCTSIAETKGFSINRSIALVKRFVRRQKGGKELLDRVNMNYQISMEPSPFHAGSLISYKATRRIRQEFLDYLDSNYNSVCSLNTDVRIAEVVYSAALFSGLADVNKLNSLIKCLLRTTYQFNEEMFVDIPLTDQADQPVFRWFPDKISMILISGLSNKIDREGTVNSKDIINNISALNTKFKLKSSKKDTLVSLVELSKSALDFEASGHIASCLTGKTASVSLPLAQWVRSKNGKALEFDSDHQERAEYVSKKLELIDVDTVAIRYSEKESKEFLKKLLEVFRDAESIDLRASSKASTQRKKELIKLIKSNFSATEDKNWSSLSIIILNWVMYLSEFGTRSKKNLAFSTVRKYSFMIARVLTSIRIEGSFLNYDESSFEEIYLKALEIIPSERRHDFAGRIKEFHSFLIESYGVEDLEWSLIFANSNNAMNYSDANLVSESEYLNILHAIEYDQSTNELTKYRYLALLIFGYRFGLRFGEAFRLRFVDFQLSTVNEEPTVILVKNTIYGDTKSEAGVRAVYLLETLTDIENKALEKIHHYAQVLFETDSQAALMTESEGSRELTNRFTATRDISYYIKKNTGDSSLRYHHLRHSWATRMYRFLVMPDPENEEVALSSEFVSSFVFHHATKAPLRSISTALGHRSETTTLSYYIHCVDKAVQNLISLDDYSITAKAHAYALCVSVSSAKKRMERQTLYSIHKNIPFPNIQLRESGCVSLEYISESQDVKQIQLTDIDFLLKRYSQTKQDIDVLAYQLMLDQKLAERVVHVAAEVERFSGFEFYQATFVNKDKLLDQNAFQLKESKEFKAENERVTEVLKTLDIYISELDSNEMNDIEIGLGVWKKTLRKNFNIITDVDEKTGLERLIDKLNLDMTLVNIDNKKSSYKPTALEKNKGRRVSRSALRIEPGSKLKTFQVVSRVLFLLSVYLEINSNSIN